MRPAPVRVGPTTTDPVVGCSDSFGPGITNPDVLIPEQPEPERQHRLPREQHPREGKQASGGGIADRHQRQEGKEGDSRPKEGDL